jgi:hypothetical protein
MVEVSVGGYPLVEAGTPAGDDVVVPSLALIVVAAGARA